MNKVLREIESGAFHDCASLTVIKFPAISKRAKNLIEASQLGVEYKSQSTNILNGGEMNSWFLLKLSEMVIWRP